MQGRRGLLKVLLASVILLALVATAATASTRPVSATYRCKATSAGGQVWNVKQSNTNCTFARYAVRTAISRRRSPKNWRCYIDRSGEFGPERRDYRVRCYRGGKRVLGLVR